MLTVAPFMALAWCWHRGEASEMAIEVGGSEQRPLGYLYSRSVLVFSSSVLSSLLSTTEQALSRNERPCNPSQCFHCPYLR